MVPLFGATPLRYEFENVDQLWSLLGPFLSHCKGLMVSSALGDRHKCLYSGNP